MITVSCPLRVSLVGGSTDHPYFIEKYGSGSVISFPSNLRTYVSIHQDVFGENSIDNNYIINYSKRESVKNLSDIKNEMIKFCFEYLNVEQLNCSLTSDIYSTGSGLAASSSYLQALIKSIFIMRKRNISEFEVCKLAEEIEKKFNPLVGQQDFYGSMSGFKKIKFSKNDDPEFKFLSTKIFNDMDMHLIYTGVLRKSTTILESLNIDKSLIMLKDVTDLEISIKNCDVKYFNSIMRRSWNNKKETSKYICENQVLLELDKKMICDDRILSHKLCGAGNGGYFLVFTNKNEELDDYPMVKKIEISEMGLKYNELTKF
jgi:D-glycero-alpha-D-manno-heptose-7-phosphate kinase